MDDDLPDAGEFNSERPVVLFVTIVSARGLPKTSGGVTSNPYIRINYGDLKYRTSTVPKSLQPIWNESFIFPFDKSFDIRYSIFDSVVIGRDTVIGEGTLSPPSRQQPVAKWYTIKARARTVRDIGRVVVDAKNVGSIGQLFVAMTLLDPLELTAMGEGLELPRMRRIGSGTVWADDDVSGMVPTARAEVVGPSVRTPKRRATLNESSALTARGEAVDNKHLPFDKWGAGPGYSSPLQPDRKVAAQLAADSFARTKQPVSAPRKSYRHRSMDSSFGAMGLFYAFCGIRKRLVLQSFGRWKLLSEVLGRANMSEESSKKMMMEARFKARAAEHKIKALENQIANIHTDKYQREVVSLKAQKHVKSELGNALSRAEAAEAIVKQMEAQLMGSRPEIANCSEPPEKASGSGMIVSRVRNSEYNSANPTVNVRRRARQMTLTDVEDHDLPPPDDPPDCSPPDSPPPSPGPCDFIASGPTVSGATAYVSVPVVVGGESMPEGSGWRAADIERVHRGTEVLNRLLVSAGKSKKCRRFYLWVLRTSQLDVDDADATRGGDKVTLTSSDDKRKYQALKKQSLAYRDQVKAHWAKTEAYMGKLKELLAAEKEKCRSITSANEKLSADMQDLENKLEVSQVTIDELRRHKLAQLPPIPSPVVTRRLKSSTEIPGVTFRPPLSPTSSPSSSRPNSTPHTRAHQDLICQEEGSGQSATVPHENGAHLTETQEAVGLEEVTDLDVAANAVVKEGDAIGFGEIRDESVERVVSPTSTLAEVHVTEVDNERTSAEKFASSETAPILFAYDVLEEGEELAEGVEYTVIHEVTPNASGMGPVTENVEDGCLREAAGNITENRITGESSFAWSGEEAVKAMPESGFVQSHVNSADLVSTDTSTNGERYEYDSYACQQWEALYAESQQQLAAEIFQREEMWRRYESLRQQLLDLRDQNAEEQRLYDELACLFSAHDPKNEWSDTVSTTVDEEQSQPLSLGGRRMIKRRLSLGSFSRTDTYLVLSPHKHHGSAGIKKNAAMSSILGDDVMSPSTPEKGRAMVFSSNLKRMFSSDADGASSAEGSLGDLDFSMPQLPEIDIAAIDVMSSESRENTLDATIVNPAVEAAMTAKLKSSTSSKRRDSVGRSSSSHCPADRVGQSRLSADASEDEQLNGIWNQVESASCESGGTNVRVAIRMRPLNARELEMQSRTCIQMLEGSEVVVEDIDATQEHRYNFDYCFDANASDDEPSAGSQQITFQKLGVEVLTNAWQGYNASLFAYGQTGSGKSYSMMGSEKDPGIIPRICKALFYMIRRHNQEGGIDTTNLSIEDRPFTVEASYLEIYNEKIRDLLDPTRINLRVREHPTTGVFVENLSTCAVESYKDVEDLLEMGLEQRTTAATNMNSESSRSHSVFTIVIRCQTTLGSGKRSVRICKLCLVDLAGSERANSTGATGARLKEGANINKSLSTLGRCISALAKAATEKQRMTLNYRGEEKKVSIPFRESVLTWLLRESLCGNAKTAMLATVSPAAVNYGESLSTLRYAFSAKQIFTQAVVNEDPTTKIINDLRSEVLRLREQLLMSKGGSVGTISSDVKSSLLQAEEALRNYAQQWEAKQQSMRIVKSKLKQKRCAAYGAGELEVSELQRTPFLTSLSNDPMLNMAVRVYLPIGGALRIGRTPSVSVSMEGNDQPNIPSDMQLEGLGIEEQHCVIQHSVESEVVMLTNDSLVSVTYINGKQIPLGDMSPVTLNDGDRVVLGFCSHIFCYCDPRQSVEQTGALPTHQQALREVLLGRAETNSERKERLAVMVWNLWKMPFYRHVFEERLVDSLKAVREASTLSHALCPTSGIFFETTLSSTVDMAALHSLRVTDLFAYSSIMIRVRCCSVLSPNNLTTRDASLEESRGSVEYNSRLSHTERVARCSRASSLGSDTVLPVPMRRQRSSFTSQLQRQWRSADAILLFESNLSDFLQGMEVLKDLYASTLPLREAMESLRRYPLTLRAVSQMAVTGTYGVDDADSPTALSVLCGAVMGIVRVINGWSDEIACVLEDMLLHGESEAVVSARVIRYVAEAVCHVGLDDVLLQEMFEHFVADNPPGNAYSMDGEFGRIPVSSVAMHCQLIESTRLSGALLDALDACLHESVVGCFDSPDMLTARGNEHAESPVPPGSTNISPPAAAQSETTDTGKYKAATDILEKLSALRNCKLLIGAQSTDPDDTGGCNDSAASAVDDCMGPGAVNDWVRCYDDTSGNFYLYSESLNQSRWEVE